MKCRVAVELRQGSAKKPLRSQQQHRHSNVHAHAGGECPVEVAEIRMGWELIREVVVALAVIQDQCVRDARIIRPDRFSHMDMLEKEMRRVLHLRPGENKKCAAFADRSRDLAAVAIFRIPEVQGGFVEGF